ncbi:MAG: FlgD immunoglobulin-like domain containing protein, partial [Candidatus Zixiibacteriota bacterium]
GVGVKDSVSVSPNVPANTDNSGPEISLFLPQRADFASGDPVGPDEEIHVRLVDTSGINLGSGFGHSITLTIDDELTSRTTLNESFVYDEGSFRSGEATATIPGLSEGEHTFEIKAWDNANNSSTLKFSALVTQQVDLTISKLLNYPNPVESSTGFFFTLLAPAEKMEMEIFTVSGIKVFEAEEIDLPQGYNQNRFVWDGRDMDGDRVATGVYLYRAVAHSAGSGSAVEEFGKLVVVN